MRKLGVVQGVYVTLLIFLVFGEGLQVHCIVDCIGIAVQVRIAVCIGFHGAGSQINEPNIVRLGSGWLVEWFKVVAVAQPRIGVYLVGHIKPCVGIFQLDADVHYVYVSQQA